MNLPLMMSKAPIWTVLMYLSFLTLKQGVYARPDGAGHCDAGDAIKFSGFHSATGSGIIDDNYTMTIGGNVVTDSSTINLIVGQEYEITLNAKTASDAFNGFLIRLGDDSGTNTMGTFVADSFNPTGIMKISERCDNNEVAGVTHNSKDVKSNVAFNMKYDGAPKNLTLDVTVYLGNWYFSNFNLNFQASPTAQPSLEPTASAMPSVPPTISPSMSFAPTTSPNPTAEFEPSASPSGMPSETPTDLPTSLPSSQPTLIPTFEPSASPSGTMSPSMSAAPTTTPNPTIDPSQGFRISVTSCSSYLVICSSCYLLNFIFD